MKLHLTVKIWIGSFLKHILWSCETNNKGNEYYNYLRYACIARGQNFTTVLFPRDMMFCSK